MPRSKNPSQRLARAAAAVVAAAPVLPAVVERRRPRRRRAGGGGGVVNNSLQAFKQSAMNPFMYSPPPLGFGSLSAVGAAIAHQTTSSINSPALGGGSVGAMLVVLTPVTWQGGNTDPSLNPGYLRVFQTRNVGTFAAAYAAGGAEFRQLAIGPDNKIQLTAQNLHFTPTTAAVRVEVRYPMTATPPRLFAGRITTSPSDLWSLTPGALAGLPESYPVATLGGGVAIAEARYLPQEMDDLHLEPSGYDPGGTVIQTMAYVLILGDCSTFQTDVFAISHNDSQSAVAQVTAPTPTVGSTVSIERLALELAPLPTFSNAVGILSQDSVFHRTRRQFSSGSVASSSRRSAALGRSAGLQRQAESLIVNEASDASGYGFVERASEVAIQAGLAAGSLYANRLAQRLAGGA